jgi:hypothetical protein
MTPAEDLTRLIREGVDEQTAGVAAPEGLASRAMRAHHRRRYALRLGAPVAVAAVVAAIAVTATALTGGQTGPRHTRHTRTQTPMGNTTYARGDITEITAVYAPWSRYPSHYFKRVSLELGGLSVVKYDYLTGERAVTVWSSAFNRRTHGIPLVLVNYRTRTWAAGHSVPGTANLPPVIAEQFQTYQSPRSCAVVVESAEPGAVQAGVIRAGLHCGALATAGRQRLDGTLAIRIVPAMQQHQSNAPVREQLWVSASSYQPLEYAWSGLAMTFVAYVTYLPPTRANLALLQPVIPPGFRRVR